MRRWVKLSVTAAVVVGLGGWIAEPYAQDWWLARDACGGALPTDAVQRLMLEDAHLVDAQSRQVDGLGSYACELTVERDDGREYELIEVHAYTRRDDKDREFMKVFSQEPFTPHAPLPEGMPGFIGTFGDIRLLLPCPDLGTDAAGRQRSLLVSTDLSRDVLQAAEPQDAYEVAVALANSASEKLGCGAEPLEAPEPPEPSEPAQRDSVLTDVEELETVSLQQARGTACGWLTEAELPRGPEWRVEIRSNGSMPVSRCDVVAESEEAGGREKWLVFAGWYGDWSGRMATRDGEPYPLTATARCRGQAAHFRMAAAEEVTGLDDTAKRHLLETFARTEVSRHDCADLRLTP